jgi:hypothetical protein
VFALGRQNPVSYFVLYIITVKDGGKDFCSFDRWTLNLPLPFRSGTQISAFVDNVIPFSQTVRITARKSPKSQRRRLAGINLTLKFQNKVGASPAIRGVSERNTAVTPGNTQPAEIWRHRLPH